MECGLEERVVVAAVCFLCRIGEEQASEEHHGSCAEPHQSQELNVKPTVRGIL